MFLLLTRYHYWSDNITFKGKDEQYSIVEDEESNFPPQLNRLQIQFGR